MTEAEILERVEKLRAGMAMRFKSDSERLEWVLDGLAELSLDLATLPYLESKATA